MIRIGLASVEFKNNQIDFNLNQLKSAVSEAKQAGCDLVCFGEAFVQGFDAFSWTYEQDKEIAFTQSHPVLREIRALSEKEGIDIAFGYLEKDGDLLYSSYQLIEAGEVSQNYRRISRGWKEFTMTDDHYQEGDEVIAFTYRGLRMVMALCGDLWDYPERFQLEQALTLWPVYVDFSLEDWQKFSPEYAEQAGLLPGDACLINSLCQPTGFGGCFHYREGQIVAELPPGKRGILVVEVE